MTLQHAAFGDFQAYPFALNGVGVVNGDLRVVQRDRADLLPGLFRLLLGVGVLGWGVFIVLGYIVFYCFLPLPVGVGRGEGIRPLRFPSP